MKTKNRNDALERHETECTEQRKRKGWKEKGKKKEVRRRERERLSRQN